eukprot:CAMPEP_0198206784 /NCGR_PEP_ID=MMETSP1445-20131203/10330_1 /TAXON_ID=36898 /ORGANISM="Pyramimonas sp., Strain CCMP2087" /LENGTH=212 /DNA_ID=CAMNT_0043879621 /DNA_START=509 /DNA_END=1143 /DNA_ORIENTATION=+
MARCMAVDPKSNETVKPKSSNDTTNLRDNSLEEPDPDEEDLWEVFNYGRRQGKEVGTMIKKRFDSPVVDDRGLPIADALVCVSAAVFVATVFLALGLPRPSWVVAAAWVPKWRSLPFVFPAVQHGSSLATCWILGALAGENYEAAAYSSTRGEALKRTLRSGAFATGILILATQLTTYVTFKTQGLPLFPGESVDGDFLLARIQTELMLDIV